MARRKSKRRSKPAPREHPASTAALLTIPLVAIAVGVAAIVAGFFWLRSQDETTPAAASPAAFQDEAPAAGGLDVLLITVDTLRADALGSYGKTDAGTPWMDRLAAAGIRFADAHAHNVVTLPSHANILSGLYPQDHGVRDNAGFRFPAELTTLATLLAAEGYRTGAFVSAFPLDSRFGLDRGFEVYEDSFVDASVRTAFLEQERRGNETVALARKWIEAGDGRPYFCWVHVYEPHFPYEPPAPWAARFRDDPYQGEVAATDGLLAPLLEPILAAGETGRTLVVLTSDHGESLGEHGEKTHGIFAYEGTLAIPLILYQPRLFEGRVVDEPARHVDLLPTIAAALGLDVPAGLRGRNLLQAVAVDSVPLGGSKGGEDSVRTTYFEALSGQLNRGWAPLYGVIHERMKYIDLPLPELYDLTRDPTEAENLVARERPRTEAARKLLAELRANDAGSVPSAESTEVRERLASLGYLGTGSAVKESYGPDDDPKRLIELDVMLREVMGLYAGGNLAGAIERCRALVRRRPGMRVALLQLAHLERENGDLGAAIAALEQAFALQPDDTTVLALLGAYLTQAQRADEAVDLLEPHARLATPDVDVLLTRALAFARLGRGNEAFASLETARAVDPENALVLVYTGTVQLMGGDRAVAQGSFEEALALNPHSVRAHSSLGVMAAEDGRINEAIGHWREAVRLDVREFRKILGLGMQLQRRGRQAEARALLELFVEAAPPETYGQEIGRVRGWLAGG